MQKRGFFCPKKADFRHFLGKIDGFYKNEKGITDYPIIPFL
jgi:hypothetical protein